MQIKTKTGEVVDLVAYRAVLLHPGMQTTLKELSPTEVGRATIAILDAFEAMLEKAKAVKRHTISSFDAGYDTARKDFRKAAGVVENESS